MTLTPAQAQQVLAAVTGKVDDDVFDIIKNLANSSNGHDPMLPGETYQQIKVYSQRLLDQYMALGRGIATDSPQEETMVVFMDPAKINRILNVVPANGYVAAFPGIHTSPSGKEEITISLLAADSNMNIIPGHISGQINGEESWDNCNIMANMNEVLRLL
jgi:hypothetical protein